MPTVFYIIWHFHLLELVKTVNIKTNHQTENTEGRDLTERGIDFFLLCSREHFTQT